MPKQGRLAEAEDLYRHVLNGLIQLYGFSAAVEEGWQWGDLWAHRKDEQLR